MMREHVLKKKMENKKARLSSSRFFFHSKKEKFPHLGKKIVCPKEIMVLEKECAIIRSDNFLGEKKKKLCFSLLFFLSQLKRKFFAPWVMKEKRLGEGSDGMTMFMVKQIILVVDWNYLNSISSDIKWDYALALP